MVIKFKDKHPQISKSTFVAPSADVIGDVVLKENSSIWFNCVLRGDVGRITIGENTNVQDLTMIHVDEPKKDNPHGYPTTIGDNVTIGHNCCIHGCEIKNNSLIGMGSTVLNGAVISEFSIVGANSLITTNKKFPPKSLIMGSPAKLIRELKDDEIEFLQQSADNYVRFKNEYLEE